MKLTLILPLLLVLLPACDLSAGSASETRQIEKFSELKVSDGIDVYLTKGNSEEARIETRRADPEDVVTEVKNGRLHIYRRNSLPAFGSAKVYLKFVDLTHIEASGGSDIECNGPVQAEELYIKASGGSDIELTVEAHYIDFSVSGGSDIEVKGSANTLTAKASGGSDLEAEDLIVQRGIVHVSGGSDVAVHVSDEIEINATGGSDAVVYGNPQQRNLHNDTSSDVEWE